MCSALVISPPPSTSPSLARRELSCWGGGGWTKQTHTLGGLTSHWCIFCTGVRERSLYWHCHLAIAYICSGLFVVLYIYLFFLIVIPFKHQVGGEKIDLNIFSGAVKLCHEWISQIFYFVSLQLLCWERYIQQVYFCPGPYCAGRRLTAFMPSVPAEPLSVRLLPPESRCSNHRTVPTSCARGDAGSDLWPASPQQPPGLSLAGVVFLLLLVFVFFLNFLT